MQFWTYLKYYKIRGVLIYYNSNCRCLDNPKTSLPIPYHEFLKKAPLPYLCKKKHHTYRSVLIWPTSRGTHLHFSKTSGFSTI